MRLFVLNPDLDDETDRAQEIYGWFPYFGTYEIAVLAEDEMHARALAQAHEDHQGDKCRAGLWLDAVAVACREVSITDAGIVLAAEGTG